MLVTVNGLATQLFFLPALDQHSGRIFFFLPALAGRPTKLFFGGSRWMLPRPAHCLSTPKHDTTNTQMKPLKAANVN